MSFPLSTLSQSFQLDEGHYLLFLREASSESDVAQRMADHHSKPQE
jgi:hypothetical protein